MRRVLACCALLAFATGNGLCQRAYAQIEDWTIARFFDELDAAARKDVLSPVVGPREIDEARFYVCLDGLNIYPDTRRLPVSEALDTCVDYAQTGR